MLYVVTAYDRGPNDGITPWLVETIRRLRQIDVDVEVLAPAYRGLESGRVDGVPIHRFRYAPTPWERLTHEETAPDRVRSRPWYLGLVPGYVAAGSLKAAKLARSGAFDLVHVHWPIPHAVLGLAARRAGGIPLVCTFHGVEITWTKRQLPFLRPFLRRVIRDSDAVTANSTYTAGLIRDVYDRPVDIVPFGTTIEPTAASAASDAEAPDDRTDSATDDARPFRLLFVGRLVERKGVHHLLDALARLGPAHRVHARVVGQGPMQPALIEQSRELGLDDVVTFDGFVDDATLARRYAEADAFVLPATFDAKGDVEGLGVVLIEAAANGLPLVASAAGGITDIVRDGETGLLVPPADADALARALRTLIDDPELARRLGRQARRYVDERFSWDRIVGQLKSLYTRLT